MYAVKEALDRDLMLFLHKLMMNNDYWNNCVLIEC